MNNSQKTLFFAMFIALTEQNNGVVDIPKFCEENNITPKVLFSEILVSSIHMRRICETYSFYETTKDFANYYGYTVEQAEMVISTYRNSGLIIEYPTIAC